MHCVCGVPPRRDVDLDQQAYRPAPPASAAAAVIATHETRQARTPGPEHSTLNLLPSTLDYKKIRCSLVSHP